MTVKLDYGTAVVSEAMEPEAITEDENGEYYVAVNTLRLRAGTNIFINKLDASGCPVWSFPREIGGDGNDRVAQIKMKDGYIYMLSTIDLKGLPAHLPGKAREYFCFRQMPFRLPELINHWRAAKGLILR